LLCVKLLRSWSSSARSALSSILRTALLAVSNALSVQGSANGVVTNTWKVLHTASANQNDRVFLKVVSNAWNVRADFVTIRQTHTANFAKSRVRLLWRRCIDASANAASLWAALKSWRLRLPGLCRAPFTNELVNCGHELHFLSKFWSNFFK